MNKNHFIDEYLKGKHPIEGESWELPTEGELERDEALYDALLAERTAPSDSPEGERKKASPRGRFGGGRWFFGIAASVLLLLVFRFGQEPVEKQPVLPFGQAQAEVAEVVEQPAPKASDYSEPSDYSDYSESPDNSDNSEFSEHVKPKRIDKPREPQPQLAAVTTTSATDSTPQLTNAADSLYYYLTQLENQMGDCRDSTCLAELGNLIQADERIKTLVNKIIHKQVETAYQEEYLVDTTTRYIPL